MRRNPDDAWDPYDADEPLDDLSHDDWDEEDWEAYFARQDVLNAKYEELLETLIDHPDGDDLIAREMHWELPEDIGGEREAGPLDDEAFGEEPGEALGGLDSIPAYRTAHQYALEVERALTAHLAEPEDDEDARRAAYAASEVSLKIAGGHGLGYDRDSLCGNIVCCKRALRDLAECFDGLLALRKRHLLTQRAADRLVVRGQRVGDGIAQHIEELRRRVWWR